MTSVAEWPRFRGVPINPDSCGHDDRGYYVEMPYRSGWCQTDIGYEKIYEDKRHEDRPKDA